MQARGHHEAGRWTPRTMAGGAAGRYLRRSVAPQRAFDAAEGLLTSPYGSEVDRRGAGRAVPRTHTARRQHSKRRSRASRSGQAATERDALGAARQPACRKLHDAHFESLQPARSGLDPTGQVSAAAEMCRRTAVGDRPPPSVSSCEERKGACCDRRLLHRRRRGSTSSTSDCLPRPGRRSPATTGPAR